MGRKKKTTMGREEPPGAGGAGGDSRGTSEEREMDGKVDERRGMEEDKSEQERQSLGKE